MQMWPCHGHSQNLKTMKMISGNYQPLLPLMLLLKIPQESHLSLSYFPPLEVKKQTKNELYYFNKILAMGMI